MTRRIGIAAKYFLSISLSCTAGHAAAQQRSGDEQRFLIAKDVCNVAAKYANAVGGGNISYQAGKFRVEQGRGSITVFEGAVPLAQVPGFTYQSYVSCVSLVIGGIERTRSPTESGNPLEAFTAGFELGNVQYVGTCLRSAAMGGFYSGFIQNDNAPAAVDEIRKLAVSASRSITRRVRRFSARDINLDLSRDLRFYQFYPGKVVPYFDQGAIQGQDDAIFDVAPATGENYFRLGLATGRMQRVFDNIVALSAILQMAQGAVQMQTYYPQSAQCLNGTYRYGVASLQRALGDLRLGGLRIPDPNDAISEGRAAAIRANTNREKSFITQLFYQNVTGRIRQSLQNM
jgi:hypothetical protein